MVSVDKMKSAAKKAWDYATEPVDAPDMDTYKKHRAKNIADIRKKKQQGVAESDLAQQMLALAKSKGMNARIAGTPEQERERTQQMLAQRAKERQEQEHQAAQADAANLPELKAKYEEMKKLYQSLGGSNWQYADREQNLTDAERKARSMEPELQRLAAQISRAEKSQGVAEGVEDNPVVNAITRRIMMQRVDLLSKYGPEKVGAAIDEVADFVGDVDEIGSSDVSGWVKHVERMLGNMSTESIQTEAYDRLKKVFDFSDFKG
jgi:chromosome segregation ATPase